jgi:uncharacterized RDD family membrane protein YckC
MIPSKPKYRLATLDSRIAAKAIDVAFILGIIQTGALVSTLLKLPGIINVLVFLNAVAYWLFADGFAGRSLGKRIIGLKVVDYKHGYPCRFGQSILRNFAWGWLRIFVMAEESDAIEAGTFTGQVVIDLRPTNEELSPPRLSGAESPPARAAAKTMDLDGIASFVRNRHSVEPDHEDEPS